MVMRYSKAWMEAGEYFLLKFHATKDFDDCNGDPNAPTVFKCSISSSTSYVTWSPHFLNSISYLLSKKRYWGCFETPQTLLLFDAHVCGLADPNVLCQ